MRTLSARILLGFAALTVTFGVITASVVFQMNKVEDQVILIGKGYVPLALGTKDVARRQEDLRNYLEERLTDESNTQVAKMALTRSRNNRDRALKTTRKILDSVEQLIDVDPRQFAVTRPGLEALERAVAAVAPLYDQVMAAPPLGPSESWDDKQKIAAEALRKLKTEERRLMMRSNELSEQLDGYVATTTFALEKNEHNLRVRTIYLGLAAV